ncbi:hypothetical protein M900_0457 [Bacteriovorax sp. Seq25_V]|nr:hypothetical protein M900_0457 [Bacteriovorax sp. Seq25_V]
MASKQYVYLSAPRQFKEFSISRSDTPRVFNKLAQSKWTISNGNEKIMINLLALSKKIQRETSLNLSFLVNFSISKNSSDFDVSPIAKIKSEKSPSLPNSEVFFFDDSTPIYESLGLPKNAHFVKTGPYYIEYNYNFGMINRIARTIASAYLYDAVVCTVDKELKIKLIEDQKNVSDITFNFDKWPKSLNPLKQSIAQIYFDHFISNENFTPNKDITTLFTQVDFNSLVLTTKVNLSTINQDKKETILSYIHDMKISSDKTPGVTRFLNPNHIKGKSLFTLDLDKTKEANNRKAYSYNKYVDLELISKVSLNRINNDFYFYFQPKKTSDHFIEIGPIDFKKLYWREGFENFGTCTEKVMKHLNEYERKAFVFEQKNDAIIDSWADLVKLQTLKKYPLEQFILTNNCRGPGNFEYEWPGLIKGYFQIPSKIIADIIDELSPNFGFDQIATEVRPTKFYQSRHGDNIVSPASIKDYVVSLWSKYKEEDYRWYRLGNFDKAKGSCKREDIVKDIGTKNTLTKNIDVVYEKGEINFQDYLGETRKKSSYIGEGEPLVYVRTPCSAEEATIAPPFGFRPPRNHITTPGKEYWEKKTCEWIPHRFRYYKELTAYPIALSKFEVDGLYSGKSHNTSKFELSSYDQKLLKDDKSRMSFDFSAAWSFKKAKLSQNESYLTIELSSEDHKNNLVIGNIPLSKLDAEANREEFKSYTRPWANDSFRGVYSLLGINPFPLSSYYGNIETDKSPIYSFFYDQDGEILNHHERDIGIEQWYVRKKGKKIIIDLLSHERITPVARIMLEL